MDADTVESLRRLALEYEGQAEAVAKVAGEVYTPDLRAALANASEILAVLSAAFDASADRGSVKPLEDFSGAVLDWLSVRVASALTPSALASDPSPVIVEG